MTPLLVMLPSSAKPILILSFDFGLIGSKPSLVEIWELTIFPHTLKCIPLIRQCRDQVHGSVGGKTPTEPKLYLFFSNLRHIEQDEVDVMHFVQL